MMDILFRCKPANFIKTTYGYVPIEIVEELINKHGGIKAE